MIVCIIKHIVRSPSVLGQVSSHIHLEGHIDSPIFSPAKFFNKNKSYIVKFNYIKVFNIMF